jgi:hypothetical protein
MRRFLGLWELVQDHEIVSIQVSTLIALENYCSRLNGTTARRVPGRKNSVTAHRERSIKFSPNTETTKIQLSNRLFASDRARATANRLAIKPGRMMGAPRARR